MELYLPYIVGGSSLVYLSNKLYGYSSKEKETILQTSDNYFEIQNIELEKSTEEKEEKSTDEKEEKSTEEKVEKTTEEKVEKVLKKKKCKLCRNILSTHCFSKKQLKKKTSICKVCWKLN